MYCSAYLTSMDGCASAAVLAGINTCWPHLKRKVAQGEYLPTSHDFFEQLNEIIVSIHFSQTFEMMELLIIEGGNLMHPHSLTHNKLRTLWNEYFVEPWACWSIGLNMDTPLNISNNQPIESWHKTLMRMLQKALKGMLLKLVVLMAVGQALRVFVPVQRFASRRKKALGRVSEVCLLLTVFTATRHAT